MISVMKIGKSHRDQRDSEDVFALEAEIFGWEEAVEEGEERRRGGIPPTQ